jgi:alkyl hydroperoxide reductase subunit F
MTYDLAIIGGGPAGVAAGVYAARKQLKTAFITKDFSNQSSVSENIQNWIGTVSVSGLDLASNLKSHLEAYKGEFIDIQEGEWVKSVSKNGTAFTVTTDKGEYEAKAVLITAGSQRRKLAVPGAETFDNKGLTYCASCDGPLFAGMDVVVVGGGNAAFETAAQLLAYCKSVTLLARSEYKADPITVKKTLMKPNFKGIEHVSVLEVKGDKFVNGIVYKVDSDAASVELPTKGIFVEIGLIPSTDIVKGLVSMNAFGQILVDPRNQRASVPGIWAAGDCTDGLYHQNNIAAGDAVKALEDIYLYLHVQ